MIDPNTQRDAPGDLRDAGGLRARGAVPLAWAAEVFADHAIYHRASPDPVMPGNAPPRTWSNRSRS